MRRPALLAFGFLALAASLPAEIRECLPMAAACEHGQALAVARAVGCARPERAGLPKVGSHCARSSAPGRCRRPGSIPLDPDPTRCRLHPTPPGVLHLPATVATPAAIVGELVAPFVEPALAQDTRCGWREAPALRPRASPCSAPFSPRPPPIQA
jgi:hypothetical protein